MVMQGYQEGEVCFILGFFHIYFHALHISIHLLILYVLRFSKYLNLIMSLNKF